MARGFFILARIRFWPKIATWLAVTSVCYRENGRKMFLDERQGSTQSNRPGKMIRGLTSAYNWRYLNVEIAHLARSEPLVTISVTTGATT